eukprot:SAG31_NODE_1495_length_8102_cov_5.708021_5_plen_76_part_00
MIHDFLKKTHSELNLYYLPVIDASVSVIEPAARRSVIISSAAAAAGSSSATDGPHKHAAAGHRLLRAMGFVDLAR